MIPPAAQRLVRRTPLVFAPALGAWLKLESLQTTGSFKLRGAAVKLTRLVEAGVRQIVAASAGNHGLGVAWAARALGVTATVVVPRAAARVKREGIAALGAEVILDGDEYDDAERAARALAQERGLPFVSPFDDDDIIDGNGRWLAREIVSQSPEVRQIVAPVGGGGLVGGLAAELPKVEVIGAQPRSNCAMHESLQLGRALVEYAGGETLCEGLAGAVAVRTFELARALKSIVLVEESQVLEAMAFAYRTLGLVIEPSSAVAIAAARSLPPIENRVVVVTGSNVDPETLDRALGHITP